MDCSIVSRESADDLSPSGTLCQCTKSDVEVVSFYGLYE